MKKFLYCAAVVALAAACTQDDELLNNAPSSQAQGQGLTFNVSLADNKVDTKGELYEDNGTYPFFWYAEQDRIQILGYNLKEGTGNSTKKGVVETVNGTTGEWTLTSTPPTYIPAADYKATQSQGIGRFTAVSDADMLAFDQDDEGKWKNATILATYGDVSVSAATSKIDEDVEEGEDEVVPGELTSLKLKINTDGSNANQTVTHPNEVDAPMYSISAAMAEESYNSVGEQANLRLIRPFPVLRFTTANVKKYAKDFGPLKSITLETIGQNGGKWDASVAGSSIAYADEAIYTVIAGEGETEGFGGEWAPKSDANKVTVKFDDSYVEDDNNLWSDDYAVYMTVAPVDRSKSTTGDMLRITYEFKNITLTLDGTQEDATEFEKNLVTKNSWTAETSDGQPNAITPLPALNVNMYNYLLMKNGEGTSTLIVNNGAIADALDGSKIDWGTDEVAITSVTKVVVNNGMTDEDFETLNRFTAATHIELNNVTRIPADGLKAFANTKNLELVLPYVTDIDEAFLGDDEDAAFTGLTKLEMGSYAFETMAINNRFFNENTAETLKYIDASSVADFGPKYLGREALIFQDFTALDSIKVAADGAELYSHQFDGCKNLQKVIGTVDISTNDATYAFCDAGISAEKGLSEINVKGTVIPAYAFAKTTNETGTSKLTSVLENGKQVVPTKVGDSAFENAINLEYMDLSKATEIGQRAFMNSGLKASAEGARDLKVGAEAITIGAFNSTKVEYIHFLNATTVARNCLAGCNLRQIKFNNVFTADLEKNEDDLETTTFGTTTNTDLLIADGQPDVVGATIEVGETPFTFKSIRVEAATY